MVNKQDGARVGGHQGVLVEGQNFPVGCPRLRHKTSDYHFKYSFVCLSVRMRNS